MLCYVFRHAESTLNANLGGGVNPDLTPLGSRQATAIADRLVNAGLRAIYSSPYCRALRTAEPLARRCGLPILLRSELCEFNPPGWAELQNWTPPTLAEVCAACEIAQHDPEHEDEFAWPPVSEVLNDVIVRTHRFMRFLKQRWTGDDDCVACFGHGLPVARLIDAWLTDSPGPAFRFVMDNAALSALRYRDGVSSLICLNEVSHLAELPAPAASNFASEYKTIKPRQPGAYW